MRGGRRPGAGRKPVEIDLVELEKLCRLLCTDEGIAAWFGLSTRTIELKRKQAEFAEVMRRGRAKRPYRRAEISHQVDGGWKRCDEQFV